MKTSLIHPLVAVLAMTFSLSAHADILFIGMNPAPGEIKAAATVAKERKEKLIVLPEIDQKVVDRLMELDRQELNLIAQVGNGDIPHSKMEKISEQMIKVTEERDKIGTSVEIKPEDLIRWIVELEAQNVSISSVVLSGHDGNGEFWGPFGTANSETLKKAFSQTPKLAQGVRSVALLGCYTSTVGALDTYWRGVFPSAEVIAGYEIKGPLAWRPSGHDYLRAFLRNDMAFAKAKDKREIERLFKNLPAIRQLAASLANRQFHVTNSGARSFDDLYDACKKVSADSDLRRAFTCHYNAETGCENAPTDTKSGPMRMFYNQLHSQEHCRALLVLGGDNSLPRGEVVLLMVFSHQILENFHRLHKEDVDTLDKWLVEMGQEPLKLRETKRNRAELMRAIRDLRAELMQWNRGLRPNDDLKAAFLLHQKVTGRLEDFDRVLLRLDSYCTPSAWVDPVLRPRSTCVKSEVDLLKNAEKAWTKMAAEGAAK